MAAVFYTDIFTDTDNITWSRLGEVEYVYQDFSDRSSSYDSIDFILNPSDFRVYPDDIIMCLGDVLSVKAEILVNLGNRKTVTEQCSWTASSNVISVDAKGVVTAEALGTGTLTVDYLGLFLAVIPVYVHLPLLELQDREKEGLFSPSVESYVKRITSQYQNSPKFLQWLRSFLEITGDIQRLSMVLVQYFSFRQVIVNNPDVYLEGYLTLPKGLKFESFDAAEGVQLDILGQIIGQGRDVYFQADPETDPPTAAAWYTLNDADYRNLLKNKMMINTWDGRASTLQAAWETLFPGGLIVLQDNQDMTVSITITGTLSTVVTNLIKNGYIIPRPQGVWFNTFYGDMPYFGFDRDDEFIAGFDTGNWV